MNSRQVLTIIGASALGSALIALPGASARRDRQSSATSGAQRKAPKAEVKILPECEPQQAQVFDCRDEDQGQSRVRVALDSRLASIGDEDNMQVVLGPGSSWLGVGVTEVDAEKVKELKLPAERGALLGKVVADSPAAKAGLKENDVVTEINGQRVEGAEQFRRMIREIPAGRTAQFTIWRDGHSETLSVTLGKPEAAGLKVFTHNPKAFSFNMPELSVMPDLSGLNQLRSFSLVSPGHPTLGIDAENLKGEFGQYFGAPEGEGVLVRGVFSN